MKKRIPTAFCALACLAHGTETATWCNPLPIPNYPIGRLVRDLVNTPAPAGSTEGPKEQFRELADPTALWLDGKWYLYPSCDMAWVSSDQGATWQHHPLNIRDVGYAPTIVKHRGKFLLIASLSEMYASDSPLGPFTSLGAIQMPPVKDVPTIDPMLFSDDDGRLFYYWGCTKDGGIWGVELDAENPVKVLTPQKELIRFDPVARPWEAHGENNENLTTAWMEGAWMLKYNGKYYFTYSAAGTEYRTYAMGCYAAESPLGPFTPQQHNPILRTTTGLVTGTAHGSIVAGPENRLWVFYCIRARVAHPFERRIGMDRAEIDAHGELFVPAATSSPQWLPGKIPAGQTSTATGWQPLNGKQGAVGSTTAPGRPAEHAVDDELRSWWQPSTDDAKPTFTSDFTSPGQVRSVRIAWRDIGLDANRGVKPGPFRYRVELETAKDQWTTILDRSESTGDFLIDYREVPPVSGTRARLVILGWPKGITPGLAEFTVFGITDVKP
jgi:hypothetical protein